MLFEQAMRGAQRKAKPEKPAAPVPAPKITPRRPLPPASVPPVMPVYDKAGSPGLDRRTAQRLARGKMEIDATLDLHGHHQTAAYRALVSFITASAAAGRRCVLVVTGKGSTAPNEDAVIPERQRGVLRANVPRWLGDPRLRDKVLSIGSARPQHGGAGAYYVLLRRKR